MKQPENGHPDSKVWNGASFARNFPNILPGPGFPYSVVTSVVTRIWNETHTEETKYEGGIDINPIIIILINIVALLVGAAAGYFFHRYQVDRAAKARQERADDILKAAEPRQT